MENRCLWCNEITDKEDLIEMDISFIFAGKYYVHSSHYSSSFKYFNNFKKYKLFLPILMLFSLLFFMLEDEKIGVVLNLVSMSIIIHMFPYGTRQTIVSFGVRKTIKIFKSISLLLLLLSLFFLYSFYYKG